MFSGNIILRQVNVKTSKQKKNQLLKTKQKTNLEIQSKMSSSYLTPAFEERCFPNPFVNKELKRLNLVEFKVKVRNLKAKLLKELEEKGIEASRSDPTIYTGICGIALLYYKMYGGQGRINDQVFEMIRSAEHPKRDRITFLCGMAGPLAILYKVEFFFQKELQCH